MIRGLLSIALNVEHPAETRNTVKVRVQQYKMLRDGTLSFLSLARCRNQKQQWPRLHSCLRLDY
jgi:hypothetical protein